MSAPVTSTVNPVALEVPEVAPTTSISIPTTVDVPKLAEVTSKSIPISLCAAVPLLGTILSKSTCRVVISSAPTTVAALSLLIITSPVIAPPVLW